MSNTFDFNPNNTTTAETTRPQHHVHDSSEPLPGAKGAAPTVDYSAQNMENMTSQRLPGSHPNRHGEDPLGDMSTTMETPASTHQPPVTMGQPMTMGQMGSGGQMREGSGGQGLPGLQPNKYGQDSLGEFGNSTPMPGSAQHELPPPLSTGSAMAHPSAGAGAGTGAGGDAGMKEAMKGSEHMGSQNTTSARTEGTMFSERPLEGQGGRENESTTKPGMADKLVGKTQKVMGKLGNNPEYREKGELRETGGKAAVNAAARTHD